MLFLQKGNGLDLLTRFVDLHRSVKKRGSQCREEVWPPEWCSGLFWFGFLTHYLQDKSKHRWSNKLKGIARRDEGSFSIFCSTDWWAQEDSIWNKYDIVHINCQIPLVYLKQNVLNSAYGRWELICHIHTENETDAEIRDFYLEVTNI